MFDFLKKKDKDEDQSQSDANDKNENANSGDKVLHAMDTGEAVPQALKDKLAEIRGEQEPEYVEVELNEDGTPVNPEHADLLKTGSVVKDDDDTSGDAVNQGDKSQQTDEAEADDSSDSSFDIDSIDPRLVEAGKKMGWDDEKISLIAQTDLTILEDIADRQELSQDHRKENKDDKDGASDTSEGQAENPALAKLKEKFGEDAEEVIKAITQGVEKKFEAKLKKVDEFEAANQAKAEIEAARERGLAADEVFDEAAKHFEEFGLTKELPRLENGAIDEKSPEMKLRGELYKVALMFHGTRGGSFKQAMRDAVQYYAGGQGVKVAARQLVKDLHKQKQRFTPKPTRRKTVKVFKSEKHKAAHIVQEAKRKAGLL